MSVEVSACTPIVWKLTLVLPYLKVTVAQVCISRFNNVFTDVVHCARLLFIPSLLFRIVLGVVQSPRLGCTCVTYTNSVSIIAWYNWDLYRCGFMFIWNMLTQYISLKLSQIWWQFVLISSRIFYPFKLLNNIRKLFIHVPIRLLSWFKCDWIGWEFPLCETTLSDVLCRFMFIMLTFGRFPGTKHRVRHQIFYQRLYYVTVCFVYMWRILTYILQYRKFIIIFIFWFLLV